MIRRDFIKNTTLLAGGMMINNSMLSAFTLNGSSPLKVGVIGCGDRGKGLILMLKDLPGLFEITAICDTLDFRMAETQKICSASGLKEYKDYRKLLENKKIDAVWIATPLNLHFPIAADALSAGKHIYLEKTMTYSISEALQLVKMAKSNPGLVLQVGHQYRYTPLYFKVKEMIEKGYLGKVTQIDCRWDRNGSWRRDVPEPSLERQINWRMYKEYSGGLVAELLSHQMDFINWAFDTHPDSIFATGGIDYYKDGRETYDNVQVMFRYAKDGMIGNFGATCSNARDGYLFKLKGTKGTISLLMNEGFYYPEQQAQKELETVDGVTGATKITWNKDGGIPIQDEPGLDGTYYCLKDFHKCITTKVQPSSNVITGAKTAISVHLANEALYNQTITNWKPEYSNL
jgi:predicted dehydrogenase